MGSSGSENIGTFLEGDVNGSVIQIGVFPEPSFVPLAGSPPDFDIEDNSRSRGGRAEDSCLASTFSRIVARAASLPSEGRRVSVVVVGAAWS